MIKAKNTKIPGSYGSGKRGRIYSMLQEDMDEFVKEGLETAELEVSFRNETDSQERCRDAYRLRQNVLQFLKRHPEYGEKISAVLRKDRVFLVRKDG